MGICYQDKIYSGHLECVACCVLAYELLSYINIFAICDAHAPRWMPNIL